RDREEPPADVRERPSDRAELRSGGDARGEALLQVALVAEDEDVPAEPGERLEPEALDDGLGRLVREPVDEVEVLPSPGEDGTLHRQRREEGAVRLRDEEITEDARAQRLPAGVDPANADADGADVRGAALVDGA